jgi:DNA-damage-inducible protein J
MEQSWAMKTETVRARVDARLKKESEEVLESLGLTTTEAIRIFLQQVRLRQGLPFPVTRPESRFEVEDILHPAEKRAKALDLIDED